MSSHSDKATFFILKIAFNVNIGQEVLCPTFKIKIMKFTRIFAAILLCSIFMISCTNTNTDEELQLLLDQKELINAGGNAPPPPPSGDPD